MKALTQQELQQFVSYFGALLEGAQLQEIQANDRGLALAFHKGQTYWLILDLVPNTPMMLLFENDCPFRKGAKSKPVALFLNSHARGMYFSEMTVQEQWGRVVHLVVKNSKLECEIEIRLIPKACNVIVRSQGKQISWEKPMELKEAPGADPSLEPRSLEEIHEQWLSEKKTPTNAALDPKEQWEKQRQKDLEKKRKAVLEIQKKIDSDEYKSWSDAGVYLKTHGTLQVPEELSGFIDRSKNLSWNIENCFFKSKQILGKKEGAAERLAELQQELFKLEKAQYSAKEKGVKLVDLMHKAEARGRKLHLDSGAIAYCGKSAADNLSLLRQAKAWDFWLHLKDYPGAHAIIHRQRDQLISDVELQQVAEWVAKESLSSKSLMIGQRVVVVYVECRFVRPIKGDKLGRVNYHSERTISFTLRHN